MLTFSLVAGDFKKGIASGDAMIADGGVFTGTDFDAATLAQLASNGIVVGPGSNANFFNLDKGKVLFAPKSDIIVQTHEGKVYIAAKSHVWIVETGNDVSISDLGDSKNGAVKVVVGEHECIDLVPGQQVLLTRNPNATFESLNPTSEIGYRDVRSHTSKDGITSHVCEFSIVSALGNVKRLSRLKASANKEERILSERMLKNAAILSMISHGQSPYKKVNKSTASR